MTARLPRQERLRSCSWLWTKRRICAYPSAQKASGKAFVPAAGFFICINHKRADKPIAAKFKAALQKRYPITLNNSRDHYSRSKYTTQVLFSRTHGLFSGFLRCKNSCRNPFKIRQLLREVGYWVVRSFPLANIPSVRVSEKLFFMALSDLLLLISRNMANNNKRLCRPSFTESQQSLFRSQYRIGCDSKPANHSLAIIRTNKMALVSAIILLSNGE